MSATLAPHVHLLGESQHADKLGLLHAHGQPLEVCAHAHNKAGSTPLVACAQRVFMKA